MDFSNKIRSPNSGRSGSQRKSPKTVVNVSHESNENFFTPKTTSTSVTPISKSEPKNSKSSYTSPFSQKRILTEKNHLSNSFKKSSPQKKTDKPLPTTSTNGSRPDSPYPLPYDPVTNYTSPRPEFLRYDPNRRMEIMQRVEKAMVDEEEGISPCTSNASTSPQVSAEKPIMEEEPSQSTSTITAVPQEQVPECGEEECQNDDEEEMEGISYAKLALKCFFLACFVSSVCYICSMSSNVGMKLHERTSEVSMLGEIVGLSKMCLSRRNTEITCGIEEWTVVMEEDRPKDFDVTGFTFEDEDILSGDDVTDFPPEEKEMFSGGVMGVRKETDWVETNIGLLAQGNMVESPEVEWNAVGDAEIVKRPSALKMQAYLQYAMLALVACLSVLVSLIAYLHKHTSKKFYRKKKQNPASETNVLMKGSRAVKLSTDNMSTPVVGNSKMHVIQTAEVDLLGESSLTDTTMVTGSSAKKPKEVELRATNVIDMTMAKKGLLMELELQATPTTPIPEASLEKIERNTNQQESAKTGVSSLRRSSRLRSRLTSI